MTWLNLVLEVPSDVAGRSVGFWSAVTGWAPDAGVEGTVALVPDSGDLWLKVRAADDVARATVAVEMLGVRHDGVADGGVAAGGGTRSPGGLTVSYVPDGRPRRFDRQAVEGCVLDQVCVDIPARWWDAELRFWAALTGRELESGRLPEFARLGDPDPEGGLRVLLQRLESPEPGVRAHPDLAVADRPAETERHAALGAEPVDVREHWTVMRAPDGHIYCLTDRDPRTGRVSAA